MKSPIPPRVSERESAIERLVTPTIRIFVATVILVTGVGVSAVFWKMPKTAENHALYHESLVDKKLAAVPLPSESVAAISPEEMQQFTLPMLETQPIINDGAERYAQVYPAPPPLTTNNVIQSETPEETFPPMTPQKFEPIREIINDKPISVEPVSQEFPPIPESVSTTERSEELEATFHFVENSRAVLGNLPEQPADPFPVIVAATPAASTLQPLHPLPLERLSPLRPLQAVDLQSFPVLVLQ